MGPHGDDKIYLAVRGPSAAPAHGKTWKGSRHLAIASDRYRLTSALTSERPGRFVYAAALAAGSGGLRRLGDSPPRSGGCQIEFPSPSGCFLRLAPGDIELDQRRANILERRIEFGRISILESLVGFQQQRLCLVKVFRFDKQLAVLDQRREKLQAIGWQSPCSSFVHQDSRIRRLSRLQISPQQKSANPGGMRVWLADRGRARSAPGLDRTGLYCNRRCPEPRVWRVLRGGPDRADARGMLSDCLSKGIDRS